MDPIDHELHERANQMSLGGYEIRVTAREWHVRYRPKFNRTNVPGPSKPTMIAQRQLFDWSDSGGSHSLSHVKQARENMRHALEAAEADWNKRLMKRADMRLRRNSS